MNDNSYYSRTNQMRFCDRLSIISSDESYRKQYIDFLNKSYNKNYQEVKDKEYKRLTDKYGL